ncbi:hypothetical protein D9M69_397440 [compost metagenome]
MWVKGQQPDPAELSGLRVEVVRLRKLLTELKTARPLVLYGDDWIEEIEIALGDASEVRV